MQFRDLKRQYTYLKQNIDKEISKVIDQTNFISGAQVAQLEKKLADYVGVKHCISCANGTDALLLALMTWNIGKGDAVFVPDFTFFSSGEVVASIGATPIFVDVDRETYNISVSALNKAVSNILSEGKLIPKVIISVDLFGQPADYTEIKKVADNYNMLILEDGAQGFGGSINGRRACSFGDISTTSFFPAKPLGCYGDGGAIFTDNDDWASLLMSLRVHGKGTSKYDNIRIGLNSRLDTLQAAVLLAKFDAFTNEEMYNIQKISDLYTQQLKELVKVPTVLKGFCSSWAQYTVQLPDKQQRDGLQAFLKENDIPSMIYYQKPMHKQLAFDNNLYNDTEFENTNILCDTVLSLPFHPYLTEEEVLYVCHKVAEYLS